MYQSLVWWGDRTDDSNRDATVERVIIIKHLVIGRPNCNNKVAVDDIDVSKVSMPSLGNGNKTEDCRRRLRPLHKLKTFLADSMGDISRLL